MFRNKMASITMAAALAVGALAGVACDEEDQKDVEEIGNNVDQEVDNLDSDGKDD